VTLLLLLLAGCTECHAEISRTQSASHHAQALRPITDLRLSKSPDGLLRYRGIANGYRVEGESLGNYAVLEWAFGAGAQGVTPVGRFLGQYFEHRFSFYTRANSLALTFGHPAKAGTPLSELGVLEEDRTIRRCFGCHATNFVSPTNLEPGVTCERCHGSGSAHIAAAKAKRNRLEIVRKIANPGRLAPLAQVQFCGQCHRLPTLDVVDEPELNDPVSVRFAPVGLLASRCFQSSKTLKCFTCHNPHEDARPRSDAFYVQQCLSCHQKTRSAIRLCRRETKEACLSCHMKQVALGEFLRFTDHRIRVNAPEQIPHGRF
jgi:hypothetical protein